MGFKKLINFKKALSLFAAITLLGCSTVIAQAVSDGAPAGATAAANTSSAWTGVFYYTLIFITVCICVGILGKILKVYDLTLKMQGKKGFNWNNIMGVCCLIFLVAGMYGAYWSITVQGAMKLPVAASAHGGEIDDMFNLTTILTLIVFVITQICLFGFLFYYRGSDKRKGYYLPHNNTIEKVWTIIPSIVLTVLVVFGFFTWQKVMDSTERKGDLNIDVTGHQFKWELRYPGPDGVLGKLDYKKTDALNNLGVDFTDRHSFDDIHADTLVMPVDKPVRLNIHAQDVIHSVFLPQFRVQLNAVPGLPTFFRFTPTITTAAMRNNLNDPKFEYTLYCNKICGGIHYNMQIVVRVVSQSEFQDWITHQKPYLTDALKKEIKMAAAKSTKAPVTSNTLALNN